MNKIMLVLSLLLIPLLISLSSALAVWNEYGLNSVSDNHQYSAYKGYFDYNITNDSYVAPINYSGDFGLLSAPVFRQPLSFVQNDKPYILFQNVTAVMVFNSSMYQMGFTNTNNSVGSIIVTPTSFTYTSKQLINGVYKINNTAVQLRGFEFDDNTGVITESYSQVIPLNTASFFFTGVKYDNLLKKLVFFYDNPAKLVLYDTTSYSISNLTRNESYKSPPMMADYDNDGSNEYITFNDMNLTIYKSDGTEYYRYESGSTGKIIKDAKPISVGGLKNVVIAETGIFSASNLSISMRNMPLGTLLWRKVYLLSSDYTATDIKLSEAYYDRNNLDLDIMMVGSLINDNTFAEEKQYFQVLNGSNGAELTNLLEDSYSYGASYSTSWNNILTTADLNHDGIPDFITSSRGRIKLIVNNSLIYNFTTGDYKNSIINCIPIDLRLINDLSIVCSGNQRVHIISSLITEDEINALIVNQTTVITGGSSSSLNDAVTSTGNIFPDSSTLTAKQKILFVLIIMISTFFLISLVGFLHDRSVPPLLLYLIALLELLEFIFFISIGYISVGVLIILILAFIVIAYFKFFQGHQNK